MSRDCISSRGHNKPLSLPCICPCPPDARYARLCTWCGHRIMVPMVEVKAEVRT